MTSSAAMMTIAAILVTSVLIVGISGTSPPHIFEQPMDTETAYKPGEEIKLVCVADSVSQPTYLWRKDGRVVDTSPGSGIVMLPGVGTISIMKPTSENDGTYQCFVSNAHGTAVTIKTTLRSATLAPFRTVGAPHVHTPKVGEPLTLGCTPPDGYPKGTVYWGRNKPGSAKLDAIENDNRVVLDYDGKLRITNVVSGDSLDPDTTYVCIANNPVLRSFIQGEDQKISPIEISGEPQRKAPVKMWTSPLRDIALKGRSKKMKCIFSGYPTPRVTWSRTDNRNDRFRETPEGYGTEIEIQNVDYEDAARYRCTGSNGHGQPQHVDLTLEVQSMPYWRQGTKPSDRQVDEDDNVEFECQADGNPRPEITWSVNGIPVEDLPADRRRSVAGTTLRFNQVTKDDNAVFQCTANNTHGHILANAALTVIAAAPTFTTTPSDAKVVRGKTVTFNCRVHGAPKPVLAWNKGSSNSRLSGRRFVVHATGDLEITSVEIADSNTYHCSATNKFGNDRASARLTVREPTVITDPPRSQTANVDDTVTLECAAATDPNENLTVTWLRNNETIDFRREQRRLSYDPRTHRLTIQQAAIGDTSRYSCRAANGLDSVESPPAQLTVRGPPEPPRDVRVTCTATHSVITWYSGADNNDPISEFVVQFRDSSPKASGGGQNESEYKAAATVMSRPGGQATTQLRATVPVRPYRSYTFRVVAKNSLGESDPSPTGEASSRCVTPQTAPSVNPRGVCTQLRATGQLVIVWQPVTEADYNGDGFYYVVKYRLKGTSGDPRSTTVDNPTRSEVVIHNMQTFSQYEISVQSANAMGISVSPVYAVVGYSGEGKPLDVPANLKLKPGTLNSTHAGFTWNPVDSSPERVRGFFRGYRITMWRVSDPNTRRYEDIILKAVPEPCTPASLNFTPTRRRRQARQSSTSVSGLTDKLWPYSRIRAAVSVLNAANTGSESDPVEFSTPEGVAGPVHTVDVVERGSNHLVVEWTPPSEPNGEIQRYYVVCRVAPPNVGSPQQFTVESTTLTRMIIELESQTVYRIEVSAETRAIGGRGPPVHADGETRPAVHPDKPAIGSIEVGENSAIVSFLPSTVRPTDANPGTSFYVEYVDKDNSSQIPWPRTEPVSGRGRNSINVTGLQPGREYTFRVVAINGIHDQIRETRSDPKTLRIGPDNDGIITYPTPIDKNGIPPVAGELESGMSRASADWYIILIIIIAILLIILLIVCIVKRTRGEMYPVYEKEKLRGRDPLAPEDAPFGEYVAGYRPDDLERSQGSLNSDEKPLDSETDSLGEYEDPEASKFNEDGSFIGLYSGPKPKPGGPTTSPYATNTFV